MNSDSGLLDEVISDLGKECEIIKHAFYRDDGEIIQTVMSEENSAKMAKVVKFYNRKMQINNYFNQDSSGVNFTLYRLSKAVFITVISRDDLDTLLRALLGMYQRFSARLDAAFHEVPDTFRKITRYLLISQGLELGPEPVAHYPPEMPPEIRMKVAMKSMLMLTAEREGAVRGIPATIPFIEYHAMGIIFLFDLPVEGARGGAVDSCISILVDESYRPAIYENMFVLENACIEASNMMRANAPLDSIIAFILGELDTITFQAEGERRTAEIEQLMKGQLRKITRTMNGLPE